MEYFVIGDDDTVLGFSLVGVSGIAVHDRNEAINAWNKTLENKAYGIIIITEDVSSMIRDNVDKYLFSRSFPLVVEIPGVDNKSSRDLRSLVNQAIGVSI